MLLKQDFLDLNEAEKLEKISELQDIYEPKKIIDVLLEIGPENLSGKLLGELAKAYNNNEQLEEAKAVLDMVLEQDRDAIWYYRYGYAYMRLSEDLNYDFETEAKNALAMLNKAVEQAGDDEDEIVEWCIELVSFSDLKKVLEEQDENYPYLYKRYFDYVDENIQNMEKSQRQDKYRKITVEDVMNIEDSWDILEPVYGTVNIYGSYEEYLESAKLFTLEQRYLLAMTWYFIEVNNGGHHQFFYNSTGIVWEDALNAFKLFDMNEFAVNFEKVIAYFGAGIPFDREERWKLMQKLEEENENAFSELLDEADDFIYGYDGEESELAYIKKHPEKFVFEGYYREY